MYLGIFWYFMQSFATLAVVELKKYKTQDKKNNYSPNYYQLRIFAQNLLTYDSHN